jgi:hypothetical protein
MSENTTNNKNVRDDEIDLLDLFRRMGKTLSRWASAIETAFLITIVFLLKRWLPLSVSVLIGIGAAYLFKTTSPSTYTSDLVLRTNTGTPDEMISHLNRLHTYSVEHNHELLAVLLSVDIKLIENIDDVSAYWIIDNGNDGIPDFVDFTNKQNVYDTVNIRMRDRLNVRVRTKSPQELTNLKNGIIKFINDDPLFQKRNVVRLRQNQEMLTRLNYDIEQLDSLQKRIFEETEARHPKTGSQFIFLQEQKTQLLYPDILSLYTNKQKLESERDLYKEIVTVLSEFTIPSQRDNGGMFYVRIYVPLFFGLTLLILIILSNRRKLSEVYNKY